MPQTSTDHPGRTRALVLGAIGVVFGDIGTSPLYAVKECFDVAHNSHAIAATRDHVMGIMSLMFWSLSVIVAVKYCVFVLRANHKGEGGVLAVMSLAVEKLPAIAKRRSFLVLAAGFGTALLYGDGMITPAISVLGAVEGLKIAAGLPQASIVWISALIIIALFSIQRAGTARVGAVFGPVMVLWFLVLAALGVHSILRVPEVLLSINPWYAVEFLRTGGWHTFLVLGSVFLCVTGAEALYADLGHFGRRPMQIGWFTLVFPALLLNYLGQGALLLANPSLATGLHFNPFYMLAPGWALLPLVVLATAAACIASQALITGAYSLTLQAIQLGFLPRLGIRHTSARAQGQIYIPVVNWALMLACVGLIFGFGSSSRLGGAYGIAVTLTMLVTSLQFHCVARFNWGWSLWRVLAIVGPAAVAEFCYFSANAAKFLDGGWFPLVVAVGVFTVMTTWRTGRRLIVRDQDRSALTQEEFLASLKLSKSLIRVPGTAVFMSGSRGRTPIAMLHNIKHNKVMHERVIFATIVTDDVPYVPREQQAELEKLDDGVFRLTGHYGFMQEPDVPQLLRRARNLCGFECEPADHVTFFLGRETVVPAQARGMALWREHLFAFLVKVAQPPASYFKLPENRVVELGMRVRL